MLDPSNTGHYVSDCLINVPSDIRGMGLYVRPVNTGHYVSDSLITVQSDIRGMGLHVGSVNTGYYASYSLTNEPSENQGVGLQVYRTTVVNPTTIRSRPRRPHIVKQHY